MSGIARMVILILEAMGRQFTTSVKKLTAVLYLTVCGLSLAMLLLFPAAGMHSFGTHFRSPEVRRTTQSHSFFTQSDDAGVHERVAQTTPRPEFLTPVDAVLNTFRRDRTEFIPEISRACLLHRMRLDSSGSGAQDPLL